MRIENKSTWQTRDLKRIFCETLRRNEKVEGKLSRYRKRHFLVVVVSAYNHLNAIALIDGAWIKFIIPKDQVSKLALAQMFEHELQHLRGYYHESMLPWDMNNTGYEWAADNKRFPLRKNEKEVQGSQK